MAKIHGNVLRDRAHDALLQELGWEVLRYWEKDILADVAAVAQMIRDRVAARRGPSRTTSSA